MILTLLATVLILVSTVLGTVCYSAERFPWWKRVFAGAIVGFSLGMTYDHFISGPGHWSTALMGTVTTPGLGFVFWTLYREKVKKVPKAELPSDFTMVLLTSALSLFSIRFIK